MPAERIKIRDLANPVLTELQKQVLAQTAAHPVTLTAEAVMAAAKAQTGLDYFGDMSFLPRLKFWMDSANADEGLSTAGRASYFGLALRFAMARLDIEDMIRRHPEIEQVELEMPLVIAGLPRSGTTYMLQLMGADKRLRSMQHWEGVRPVPDRYMKDGKDRRFEIAAAEFAEADAVLPYMKSVHEFAPDHITEDIELTSTDFGGYYPEWFANIPQWRDYQLSHDPEPWLRYLRRAIQLLVWQKGPKRWVGKCPQHIEQLAALDRAFGGAFIIINHRDPVASIQSIMTGVAYSARLQRKQVDMQEIASYWIDRYERMLRRCVRDRDQLDPDRCYDLYFHDLMNDPFGRLEEIYTKSGVPFDDETRAAFNRAIDENKRGKHGQLEYDLRGDFGLDPAVVRKRFNFYFERFPRVQVEVR
jgi:hypothetical protein